MIKSFPKIFSIGQDYILDLFKDPVEITEKIDGSQFNFGKIDGELFFKSHHKEIYFDNPDKMFKKAVDYVLSIKDKLRNDIIYYGEYLQNPRQNILEYQRIPRNNIILFGASDKTGTKFIKDYNELKNIAQEIDLEIVPLLNWGEIKEISQLEAILENQSILGNTKIEGIVVKNYEKNLLIGGQVIPIMMGKFVREDYKEVHRDKWGKEKTSRGRWETFKMGFKTEARWQKAIQHLKEKGELENSPRDIGKLLKEIGQDIKEEEQEDIKNFLWKEFGEEIIRHSTKGFPEWYKEQLLKRAF